ncbi:hypothetical protein [Nocardia concava]
MTEAAQRREVAEVFRRALAHGEAAPLTQDDLVRMNVQPGTMSRVFDGVR